VAVAAKRGGAVAVWASRETPELAALAEAAQVPLYRIEDGFIRSAGLGAGLVPPASIVVDSRGRYFDPAIPSDLEHLLETGDFDAELLARAEALIALVTGLGVTKYNLGGAQPALPALPPGRRLVLVPGQVSDDASVLRGGAGITDMAALLARVRAADPEAFILFKPHPDVDAGLRNGAIPDAEALRHADLIVRDAALPALLDRVDAVHTLTSLTGFEALLRRRAVACHGQPFYAGWGLTTDLAPLPRRTRRRSLAELVAATLILYPRYCDPVTGAPSTPEALVQQLANMAPPRSKLRATVARLNSRR
jgi:capsular polysaccharide export protein